MKSTTLYYSEGSSDKVYQAAIEPRNNLFVVTFAFGRRGTTLQTGIKTPEPVDLPTAEKVFDKLVREKTAKGYTPQQSGTPYQQPDQSNTSTGIRPQLLNAIDEAEASKLVSSADWCMQEKMDGRRLIIRKEGTKIDGINRRGLFCGVPVPVVQEIIDFDHNFIIDGEILDETYFVFDLLRCNGHDWTPQPYSRRYDGLDSLFGQDERDNVVLLETTFHPLVKAERLPELQKARAEGVVFKLLSAPYAPGRPNTGGPALKYKFTTTASCIVAGLSVRKRSVQLALLDDASQKADAGNVTIPPNYPIPKVGDVVEIRYLYAFKQSGALYQPVFLGRREDINVSECTTAQLKFKPGEDDDQ